MEKILIALQGAGYRLLLQGFTDWVRVLGYSPLSIPVYHCAVKHFLYWLETEGKLAAEQLQSGDGSAYLHALQARVGYRSGRPLSAGHLNKTIQSLHLFSRYLRETGKAEVGFTLQRSDSDTKLPVWLTCAEIQALYDTTMDSILGLRDRAMLVLYYDCGLRLNEGVNVEVSDVDLYKKVLHVRKGKRYRERYVPLTEKSKQVLQGYLEQGRPALLQQTQTNRLFIDANKGRPLTKQSLYIRIRQLAKKAKLTKRIGTHTLRHSIATHLLHRGMKLERIKDFLGHSSLDSTQIYTHLKNELR